jgi:hypothetical protein
MNIMAENTHHHGHQGNQGQSQTHEQSHQSTSNVAQMAKDAASSAGQMAKDAASSAGKMASDQAQHAAERVAGGMRSFAGTIRENAPEGMLGTAAGTVADTLESGGRYLEQEGLSGMAEDLITVVRRYPIPSMLVCAGVGFLLGRMLTSSHSNSGSY